MLGYLFCFTALCLTPCTRPARWPETVAAVVLAALIGPAGAIYSARRADLYDSRCQPCLARQALAGWPHCQSSGAGAGRYRCWVQVNMGAALYAARDVDTVGILRAGDGAATAGAALLALLYWKIRRDPKKKKIFWVQLPRLWCWPSRLGCIS